MRRTARQPRLPSGACRPLRRGAGTDAVVDFLLTGMPLARSDLPAPWKRFGPSMRYMKYRGVLLPPLLAPRVSGVVWRRLLLPFSWTWPLPPAVALLAWIELGRG